MGGVWERQIRIVHNVLPALQEKNGCCLDEESKSHTCKFYGFSNKEKKEVYSRRGLNFSLCI